MYMGILRNIPGDEETPAAGHVFKHCVEHSTADAFKGDVNAAREFVTQHFTYIFIRVVDNAIRASECRNGVALRVGSHGSDDVRSAPFRKLDRKMACSTCGGGHEHRISLTHISPHCAACKGT